MKITFNARQKDFDNLFGKDTLHNISSKPFEIKVNDITLVCHPLSVDVRSNGWDLYEYSHGPDVCLVAECYDKRAEEIAEAKGSVNRAKEALKKAERKLEELQEGK